MLYAYSSSSIAALSHRYEPRGVLAVEMQPQPRLQSFQTVSAGVIIEVAQSRREGQRLDPDRGCARLKSIPCRRACEITVAQHVESPQASGKADGGQMSDESR